jgi:hypothetical protein
MLLASSTLVTCIEAHAIHAEMVLSNTLVSAGESLDEAPDRRGGRRSER